MPMQENNYTYLEYWRDRLLQAVVEGNEDIIGAEKFQCFDDTKCLL